MAEHVNLRGNASDDGFLAAVRGVLRFELPRVPNTTTSDGSNVAYWLGPDEWLLATNFSTTLAWALKEALAGTFAAVTEVGGGNEVLVLEGAAGREALAAECPLDLDPRAFGPGQCAQTRFAHAAVLLRPLANGDIELVVRRSFAEYVRQHLSSATPLPGSRAARGASPGDPARRSSPDRARPRNPP
jgi:sarcosine oxidase, subunit gamma